MGGFCGYGGSVLVMVEWAVGYWVTTFFANFPYHFSAICFKLEGKSHVGIKFRFSFVQRLWIKGA